MSMPALQPRRLSRLVPSSAAKARLSVVPRLRTRAPRVPFLALVTVVLVGGVIGLLMFNTSMQQASFSQARLEQQAEGLTAEQQSLEMEIEQLRDPQRVAQEAQRQGMVLPISSGYIQPDGTIVGKATPATGEDPLRMQSLPAKRPPQLDPAPVIVQKQRSSASQPGARRSNR